MLINEFSKMSQDYQVEHAHSSGIWLMGIVSDIFCYHLYWVDKSYFVEISVNVARQRIQNVTAFTHSKYLNKYLDRIEIHHLTKS
jgi:hypothetical protein